MTRSQSETNGGAPMHAPDSRNPFLSLLETLNRASTGGFDTAHFNDVASAWPDPDATLDDVLTLCNEALKDGWTINPPTKAGQAPDPIPQLIDDLTSALSMAQDKVQYYHEHEGCPVTLRAVKAALAKAEAMKGGAL